MSDVEFEVKPDLVECVACENEFDLNNADGRTIVGETGSDVPIEMEVDLQECPHCGVQACYD